jgi:small subunit ribosomal protein S2
MNTELKSVFAVSLLVIGLLQGMNVVVDEEPTMAAIIRTVLLLGAAALFYLWMMRDQRSSQDAAEESMDEVEKQLDAVKEAIQDVQASAAEKVEEILEDVGIKAKDEESEAKPVTEEPTATVVEEKEDKTEPKKTKPAASAPKATAVSIDVDDDATGEADDLTKIEGIGPSYRDILVKAGVDTFAKIAAMSEDDIVKVVRDNGGRKSRSMGTWAEQAKLAAASDWDGLQKLQDSLSGGRK